MTIEMDAMILEMAHRAKRYREQAQAIPGSEQAWLAVGIQECIDLLLEQDGKLFDLAPETVAALAGGIR